VLLFVILMGAYYAMTFLDVIEMRAIPAYMRLNARASAAVLNVFGENTQVRGTSITSDRFSVDIQHGCDAIDPSALFLAAVLAFPAPFRSKLPGLLIGTIVIALVNLIRIITLFYTGIYFPRAFQAMHVDVWQPVFILLALIFWVTWAWWATRNLMPQSDVSSQEA
jgi:exosortase H (IPTLxxWG-CTERM-specific)